LNILIEIAVNSLKTQEKSERPLYHKDLACFVKQQLETAKGYDTKFLICVCFLIILSFFFFIFSKSSGTWHVVVGSSFGSFISHETKKLVFLELFRCVFLRIFVFSIAHFFLGSTAFLIWKHG
jgi:hypothetical protein